MISPMLARAVLTFLLVLLPAVSAFAKEYRASRFDVRVEVLRGGSLKVTETIVFEFTEGTFKYVFRTIPTRYTDGVEFLHASMDGVALSQGDGPGQVEVRRKNGLRIDWHFAPVGPGTHTFELAYLAHGVVRLDGERELLAWRALPREHDYAIGASTIQFVVPAEPYGEIKLEKRRVDGQTGVAINDGVITFQGTLIRRNGWLEPRIRFQRGDILDAPPLWQQRQARHRESMPTWAAVAGGIGLVALMLLVMLRQGYDSPSRSGDTEWASLIPPDTLPPAIAGALVTNGQPRLEHAMAAILGLAERGIISIREDPKRRFGQRSFTIERHAGGTTVAPHEQAVLDVIFRKVEGHEVSLAKARTNLVHRWTMIRKPIMEEMRDLGLIDAGRAAHRKRYQTIGLVLIVFAAVGAMVAALLLRDDLGPWPLLVPLALALAGLASLLFAAAETPLSNEGVRRAAQWSGYRRHLRHPQDIEPRWGGTATAEFRVLPYAVAMGLAGAWAKFMKKRGVSTPAWFQASSQLDSGVAFSTFIATGGAGSTGGGAGAGGGAAGGGGSGAG